MSERRRCGVEEEEYKSFNGIKCVFTGEAKAGIIEKFFLWLFEPVKNKTQKKNESNKFHLEKSHFSAHDVNVINKSLNCK